MANDSAFSKDKIKNVASDQRDFLEQLNLPPQLISFVRGNSKHLQIAAICIAILFIGWTGYGKYAASQREKATDLLAVAIMQETSADSKIPALQKIISEYPRSEAALWAKLEIGHQANDKGNYQEAIEAYNSVLNKLDDDASVSSLVQYSLASAYEANKDLDNALKYYQKLTGIEAFAEIANLAVARIYELKGDTDKAIAAYEAITTKESSDAKSPSPSAGWIADKLAKLKPPAVKSETSPNPEGK